jgi:hypothetical protein
LHPGVSVGFGAFVAANSVVRADVADASCVKGDPAEVFCHLENFISLEQGLRAPWPNYFRRGYPPELMAELDELLRQLRQKMEEMRNR